MEISDGRKKKVTVLQRLFLTITEGATEVGRMFMTCVWGRKSLVANQ